MISRLSGTLLEVQPPYVVIDVNGVGYELETPLSVLGSLPRPGEAVVLLTHLQVSQDHQTLYGFATRQERRLFRQLLKVSGIGAKLALTILSGASGDELARYVTDGDAAALTRLPGIGKKTAERIIVELRDKLDDYAPAQRDAGRDGSAAGGGAAAEARNALRALGYRDAEATHMVRKVADADMSAEEIIRRALKSMVKA
jgi:Holliday junction DNA helicase RuvA